VLDLPWLARGSATARFGDLRAAVGRWRRGGFDTAINLEGDIRSHVLMRATGIPERVGFDMAGGGPVLTRRVPYDPATHVADNCVRLIERAVDLPTGSMSRSMPPLVLPDAVRAAGAMLLADAGDGPLVGIHPSGGRAIKQWDLAALATSAATVAARLGATIVLTGTSGDRAIADAVRTGVPDSIRVVDLVGRAGLGALAAVLERLTVFISADTGPMHIAAALGTPTVGIFGPSDPRRWGPLGPHTRVVRAGIWCSPCNLIRNPPERCRGHVPDCLAAVTPDMVAAAALDVAAERPHGSLHGRA
jgi:ADP-heptose:LPS heptosyltransferase